MSDDTFVKAVNQTDASGAARYGADRWRAALDAITRQGGISEAHMREIVSGPDPAALIYTAGKEALLAQSDAGDTESERIYKQMRDDERAAHRKYRNR